MRVRIGRGISPETGSIFPYIPQSARFVSNEVLCMKMDVSELSYSQIQRIASSLPLAVEQISIRGNRVCLVMASAVC